MDIHTKMGATISAFFHPLRDSHVLLGTTIILVLLSLVWEILHSYLVGKRISQSLWGRHLPPPVIPKIFAKLLPVIEWVRSRARELGAALCTRGITMQLNGERDCCIRWHRIRQLLCDDPACVTCELAAREASQCADAIGRPGSHEPLDLNMGLPGRRGQRRFARSASVPAPTSVAFDLSPARPASCSSSPGPSGIPKDPDLPFKEHAAFDWDECSHPSSHHRGTGALTLSSSTSATSHFTRTKSSSVLSEFSIDSLVPGRSTCQFQMALTEQEDSQGSSWTESEASLEHQMGRPPSPVPQERPRSQTSLPMTATHSPTGPREDQVTELTTANVPFLEDAVIASLESHVLVKRVQHHLGLPVALLRSLRSFMLPAPGLTPRRRLRELGVLTRPQALPFVAPGTRKKLETHLKRMVRLKRWQLTQKIQGALSQMKTPLRPRGKKAPSAVRKQGSGVTGQAKGTRRQRAPARLPTTARVLESKTTQSSQVELQSHLVKKSLEISLEIFPAIVGHSQKMSSRSRVLRLPKLIPSGQSCPQLRNRPCLALRSKADTVDMNLKCKYIHFLWGLPTIYLQSLSKIAPCAAALPRPHVRVHATIEFVSVEPPFVGIWGLEYHILRKRLQHQWGLPSLVLRSVKQFLTPVPSLPTRAASAPPGHLKVKILTSDPLYLFTRLEIKEKLETHVKTKIIERRWGLPKRALDSLRVFISVTPPRVRRPKENEKTFALPRGEKLMKRKTATKAPRSLKKRMVASGKALQRHLTKKALEVQLGIIAPMAKRSQDAARRVGKKHMLPKVIPAGLKPLVPRPQELLFVDPSVLGNLQRNIIHKGLMYKWGLLTAYHKSLAQLFQDTGSPSSVAQSPNDSTQCKFTALQTPFLSQRNREVLEWHVRRKSLQHTWGLPGLIQRSLRYLLPAAPCLGPRKGRHTEVAVSVTEPTFLSNAVRRKLERNVQKRKINQQWQLPRRVLESLRLLHPGLKPDSLSQKPPGFPFAQRRGSFPKGARPRNLPAPLITGALCPECSMREMGATVPQRSQAFPMLGSTVMKKMELHWTKKCVEVQLEAFPAVVKGSWKRTSLMSGQRLPKLIPPGRKPLQPRKCCLPFVSHEDAGRMEVAVQRGHLMSLWGLGVRYVEGLHAMIPSAPTQSLRRRKRAALGMSEGQALFLDAQARETLELHVRRKWLQHEWGLPILIRNSVQAFVQGCPLSPAFHKTQMHIETLQQTPAFLPRGVYGRLEHHLQRLKLQRQWGLPRRVLRSLHLLMPETEPHPAERRRRRRRLSTKSLFAESSSSAAENERDAKEAPRGVVAALCPTCQGSPPRGAALENLRRHLAKKSVEVHLGVFPAVPRLSWKRALFSSKQPLPKLILPGRRVLEPHHASFPFLRAEEMDRVELALRCSHLASLWGLGARYVEALVAMAPRQPFHPVKGRRAAFGLAKGKPPFFQGLDTETLEMHIKKKRLQHEWGLPALALRSLRGFVQEAPTLPHLSKTVTGTYVLPRVLSFLPRATCSLLEFHVQRMKLQRRWGLPARILVSLKAFLPSASWEQSLPTLHYQEQGYEEARSSPGEPLWAGKTTKCISSEQFGRSPLLGMENHLKKKYLETYLGVVPALVSQSRAAASGWKKTRLPKLVRAGQKHPTGRVVSPSFLLPATVDLLEINVKRKHLAFLWGLPSQYMEPLSMLALRGHSPVRFDREKIRFQEAETPFCQKEARETLEYHIQKKRLHHHWGLPSTIQRSLQALTPALSTYAHPRQKTSEEVKVLVADLPFVSALAQNALETSLKKMIIHGQWGLPVRLQRFLHVFTPIPLADRELQKEEAAHKGIVASGPDTKRAQRTTRPPHATSVGLVSRQAPLQTSVSPILGLLRSSKIRTLETHLKKKSLEIKFQLPVVGIGTIKQPCLPKCVPLSPVVKPRGAVLFVEPEALLKITLNIKHKYLTYLWGLPSLYTESLKKMFETVPEWPQEKTVFRTEAMWKGHGGARPRRWTGNAEGFGSRSLQSPKVKLSFLTDMALDLLEGHIRHKKLQHEWSLPSTIQKSLCVFAPFPSEARRSTPSLEQSVMRWCGLKVSVSPQSLLFLDPDERRLLEEHVRSRTAAHRWGIPKRVQLSLKSFLPPVSLSQGSKDRAQTLLCHCDQVPRTAARRPQSQADGLQVRVTSRGVSPRRVPAQEHGAQQPLHRAVGQPAELSPEEMHQDKTPRHRIKTPEKRSHQAAKFLSDQAWDLLEFHIRRKRIQHEWGLPSLVQKSLRAFAPPAPDSRVSRKPRAGAYMVAKGLGMKGSAADHTPPSVAEVSVPFQATMFLDPEVKSQLEAHVRSRITAHRWGLPQLVQDSLRAFLPPELNSQTRQSQSHQQHETRSDSEGNQSFLSTELRRVEHRTAEKQKDVQWGTPVATLGPSKEVTAFISPEPKLSFLPEELLGLLAFHIQHKKIQHMWGLPSTVLKSLHVFAPFPFETKKSMQHTGKIITEMRPHVGGEVRVVIPSLSFLSPDTKLHLDAHLNNMVAKHRWGLPALVQQSLKGFLPPSPSTLPQAQPLSAQPHKSSQVPAGHHDDSKKEAMSGRRETGNRESIHQKKQGFAFLSPVGRLPFLTVDAHELLEFHIQRKKVQHLWGLPYTVLKSLHVFAPFPFETEKSMEHTGKIITQMRPQVRGEVHVVLRSLSFLSPDTKLHLDAHLHNMVTKHRWGLPALVQQSLKGFLPPRPSSPSTLPQAQPLSAQPHKSFQVAGGHHDDSKKEATPRRQKTGNRENIHQKKQVTAFLSPVGRLPFLTGEAHKLLEFHMQRKKVQHLWGLPSTVLKSLHAFAPLPREPEKHAQDAAKTLTKRRLWDTEIRVPVRSLIFLGADVKEGLEAHVRGRIAEHRWGLPKLVQKSLRALLPPVSLSFSGEMSRQPSLHPDSESPPASVSQPGIATGRSTRKLPGRRETSKEKMVATSSTASVVPSGTSLVADLPFLTNSKQDVLEFHIQRKKIQHGWGLPLTVQKSVHAFAPVPSEQHQGVPSTAGGSTAVAEAKNAVGKLGAGRKKPWITGTVNVAIPSLHFLGPDTKENLEAHLRNLTIEHRWGIPTLVHKSLRAFIPLPSHLDIREMENQEDPLTYSCCKTLMASDTQFPTEATKEAGSEDQRTYHSKPWHKRERGGRTDSHLATEEPLYGPDTKPEHAMAILRESNSWKAGRGTPQRSTLKRMAEGSHPQAGLKQPQVPDISYSGWELGGSQKEHAYPCVCYLTAHRDDSGSSLPSDAEQIWGNTKGIAPDSSEYTDHQGSGLSSEDSQTEGSHQEPEFPSAHIEPESAVSAPHCSIPVSKEAGASLVRPSTVVQPPALCEDTLAGPHRQAGKGYQEYTKSSLRKRESRLGWNREKKKVQSRLPGRQPSVRALRRWSSKDLCEACRSLQPPLLPKGSENPTHELALSSPDSREFNQRRFPAPQNQGSLERKSGFQDDVDHNLQAMTDDELTEQTAERGTVPPSKEPRPLSTGAASQFSTECEWERVGDWDTEEEDAREREKPRKVGSARNAGETPRTEASLKARRSPKRASSPAAKQSQTSPKSTFLSEKGPALVKIERRSIRDGGRTVVRESVVRTVRVTGTKDGESQRAREEEEGVRHWKKGPSQKGLLPGKETSVRHGGNHPFRVPRGTGHLEREALKMAQEIRKGMREEGQHAQFVQGVSTKDTHRKLSLLGTIVEKKLFLRHGFRVWVQIRERERRSHKKAKKSPGASQPPTFQTARAAQMKWVEVQCCSTQGITEPRSAGHTSPARPQQRQASKMGSPTSPGYPHRASRRRKKEVTQGRSRSRERRK